MKKLSLFLAASSLALSSCSGDDSGSSSNDTVKFTFDGTVKTYKQVTVQHFGPFDDGYLTVTATNNNTEDFVTFDILDNETGTNALDYLNYFTSGVSYYAYGNDEFGGNVTVNSDSKLEGTFAGPIFLNGGDTYKIVTNGSFKISY